MKKEDTKKHYTNIKISKPDNSEIEIEGEILAEYFDEHHKNALKKLLANAEVPGFRKGNAPERVVLQHYSDAKLLEGAAQDALDAQYWNILSDNSIKALGEPSVTITKLAKGNPLGFKIKTAVFPEFTLPDYKKIAGKIAEEKEEAIEVEQKEVDEILKQLQHSKLHEKESHVEHGHSSDDHLVDTEHKHDEKDFPPLDDAFAQSVAPEFKTLAELTEKIRENMLAEKKYKAKEKKRLSILEALVEKTEISVPEILIESELQKMIAQFKDDVAKAGLTYETYLEHAKKTEADIRKEWRENAMKRAKTQLILGKIGREEKIELDEEVVNKEIEYIVSHHKNADRFRARMFIENMMQNEKVLEFLEGVK